MQTRDIYSAHLLEDLRVKSATLFKKQIFKHEIYELHICIFPGIDGHKSQNSPLVTALVVYKEEGLRIMLKLWTCGIEQDWSKYLDSYVLDKLKAEMKSPLHIVRDAKKWCNVLLTKTDEITLIQAGITV